MTLNIEELGLKEVINASGKMTILGVSKVSESVLAAQRYGGEHFFEMADLAEKTGAYLAELLKTEDAQIVSSRFSGDRPISGGTHRSRRQLSFVSSI